MTDYEFVKEFNKIKVSKVCNNFNINGSNVLQGTTSEENYKKIKEEIEKEILSLFIKDITNSEKILTLYLYDELLCKLEKENKMLREML